MKQTRLHALSFVVAVVMLGLAFGSGPAPGSGGAGSAAPDQATVTARQFVGDYVDKMGVIYTRIAALVAKPLPDTACDAAKMLSRGKPGPTDYSGLALDVIYGPFLARFASKDESAWKAYESPWKWMTGNIYENFSVYPRTAYSYQLRSAQERMTETLIPRRYMLIAWPDDERKNHLPVYHEQGKTFEGGLFDGHAFVADVLDGTIECQRRIHVESSPLVKFRSGSMGIAKLFDEHPDQAVLVDFQDNAQTALSSVLPGNAIHFASSMGSVFK